MNEIKERQQKVMPHQRLLEALGLDWEHLADDVPADIKRAIRRFDIIEKQHWSDGKLTREEWNDLVHISIDIETKIKISLALEDEPYPTGATWKAISRGRSVVMLLIGLTSSFSLIL